MRKLTLLFFICLFSSQLLSQSFYNRRAERSLIASIGTGTTKYYGELSNKGKLFEATKWNLELGLEYRIDSRFSARTSLTSFQISQGDHLADNAGKKKRNLSFTTTGIEFAATGTVQLFEDGARYYQRKPINLFLSAGIAVLYYVPKGLSTNTYHDGSPNPSAGKMVPLRELQTEQTKYSPVTLAIPIGGGVKIMTTPFLNVTISGAYRFTFTDYLDDVSTVYPGVAAFSDPLAAAMSDKRFETDGGVADPGAKRGNPDTNDSYFIMSIRVDYFLPPTIFGGGVNKKRPRKSKYRNGKIR